MRRPWPRPYECVRRAWHSDRHQPMRGSLIKEIFRIAHEIHSPTTKKNKEWQEKLPIVVLNAEEIMYSKANSEAEYMDLKTAWERVNDAIDTIIRRDESGETGEFLQPCIEAALGLGCVPRRASRSQRNTNPRFYLGSYTLGRGGGAHKPSTSLASQCSNFLNPPTTLNSKVLAKDPPQNSDVCMLNGDINISPLPAPLGSSSYSAYPCTPPESHPSFVALPTTMPKASFFNDKELSTMMTDEDQPEKLVCDLSLRLAPLSVSVPSTYPSMNVETRKRRAVEMAEDHQQQTSWQPKLLCAYSGGSARIAGL